MWTDLLLVAGLGTLLSLDERAVFQGMLAHPLAAGVAAGWVLGEPLLGFEMGLVVGLLWSYALPVGGIVPPSGSVVATAAVAMAEWMGGEPWTRLAAILWATPFGLFAGRLEGMVRGWNVALARRCEAVGPGELGRALWTAQLVGVLGAVVAHGVALTLAIALGAWVLPALAPHIPEGVRSGLGGVYPLLPFVGLGAAVVVLKVRRSFALIAGVFLGLYGLVNIL